MKRPFITLGLMALTGTGLMAGGCAQMALDAYSGGIFQQADINLTQSNYAAADYLIQQGKTYVSRRDLVRVEPIGDMEEPLMQAPIGRMIPEQVGVRLSQLGYAVDLGAVAGENEGGFLKPSNEMAARKPGFVLSGNYVRSPRKLDVKLRLTEIATGQVIAAYDYSLPLSREIARLAEPEPRIMKLEGPAQ